MLIRLPRPKSMITWRFYFWYFRDRYCSLYSPQLCWGLNGRSVSMKVRFTAEIIDDDGNVIGNRVSEAGGIPCPDDFDLSTKEGFLRDFDKLEKAVLKARNQIGKDIVEETLDNASKKTKFYM